MRLGIGTGAGQGGAVHRTPRHEEDGFYAGLGEFDRFEEVANEAVYTAVPSSWWVLVTDVKGSTRAIEAGRYKEVNALGVSTITAVVNAIPDIPFPYVFGGDGATLVIPPGRVEEARAAAAQAQALARDAFGMELRAGMVSVAELKAAGGVVRVARFRISGSVTMAMFSGGGLSLAEKWVKDPAGGSRHAVVAAAAADPGVFDGFQCRWRPVPSRRGQVISLLILAREGDGRGYPAILEGISATLGRPVEGLCPIEPERMRLASGLAQLRADARVATRSSGGVVFSLHQLKTWLGLRVGNFLFRMGWKVGRFNGATYRQEVVENTDYRKFDDLLRMVLDLTREEIARLRAYLESERQAGRVYYGLHESDSALMTCFIRDFGGQHLHFLDGSNGGYAMAARQMKQQAGAA